MHLYSITVIRYSSLNNSCIVLFSCIQRSSWSCISSQCCWKSNKDEDYTNQRFTWGVFFSCQQIVWAISNIHTLTLVDFGWWSWDRGIGAKIGWFEWLSSVWSADVRCQAPAPGRRGWEILATNPWLASQHQHSAARPDCACAVQLSVDK